jgi:histidinol phosphatase-like enzyme
MKTRFGRTISLISAMERIPVYRKPHPAMISALADKIHCSLGQFIWICYAMDGGGVLDSGDDVTAM